MNKTILALLFAVMLMSVTMCRSDPEQQQHDYFGGGGFGRGGFGRGFGGGFGRGGFGRGFGGGFGGRRFHEDSDQSEQ